MLNLLQVYKSNKTLVNRMFTQTILYVEQFNSYHRSRLLYLQINERDLLFFSATFL